MKFNYLTVCEIVFKQKYRLESFGKFRLIPELKPTNQTFFSLALRSVYWCFPYFCVLTLIGKSGRWGSKTEQAGFSSLKHLHFFPSYNRTTIKWTTDAWLNLLNTVVSPHNLRQQNGTGWIFKPKTFTILSVLQLYKSDNTMSR